MIKFILVPVVMMLSCGSTKSNKPVLGVDSAMVTEKSKDSVNITGGDDTKLPTCIQNKIDSFKLKESHEIPQKVVEYKYKGKTVYFVVMPCCDFFNEVYDDKCNYLGAPDGGFTGKGDGLIPDFHTEAKDEKIIWKAPGK